MEPGGCAHTSSGDQCTLGTSQASLTPAGAQGSASPTPTNRTLQGPCSSDETEELASGAHFLSKNGDRNSDGTKPGLLSKLDTARAAQRSSKTSAFPSLTWDSDSEKEAQDEEELQHFCNPHGLAAHSPGSPTSGCEPGGIVQEGQQTPEGPKPSLPEKESLIPIQDQVANTQKDGPRRTLSTELKSLSAEAGSVSRDKDTFPPKAKAKPKVGGTRKEDSRTTRDDNRQQQKAREAAVAAEEKDVYSFPGDSDPESPPPAPWAHCTFVERRRRKRALLRPFSGLGSWQRTAPGGSGRKLRVAARRPKDCGLTTTAPKRGVFDYKEEEEEEEDEDVEEEEEEEDHEDVADGKGPKLDISDISTAQQPNQDVCQEIFTCVECSIYFKKKDHLRDHMQEHSQREGNSSGGGGGGGGGGTRTMPSRRAKTALFECKECGLVAEDRLALAKHQRRHQEARCRILEEISKLEGGGESGSGKKAAERSGGVRGSSNRAHTEPRRKRQQQAAPICHQFVCLKCNFSTDIPQELADHAKQAHAPRRRAGMLRCSPRLQPSPLAVPAARPAGLAAATTSTTLSCDQHSMQETSGIGGVCEHLCPAHSSSQQTCISAEMERQKEQSGGDLATVTTQVVPQEETVEKDTVPRHTPPQAELKEEAAGTSATTAAPGEEDSSAQVKPAETQPDTESAVHEPPPPPPTKREVAFKCIGNRRSARGNRSNGSKSAARAFGTTDNGALDITGQHQQQQSEAELDDQPVEKTKGIPDASAGTSGIRSKDPVVEVPAAAKRLKHSFAASLQGATDEQQVQLRHMVPLVLIEILFPESQTHLTQRSNFGGRSKALDGPSTHQQHQPHVSSTPTKSQVKKEPAREEATDSMGSKSTAIKEEEDYSEDDEDDDDDEDVDEDDIIRFLNGPLSDDEDEEIIKSMERRCPYCSERFYNGIGLANHVRGHLNRVGVSYNVRHFISPEEVNAIEKKFSYQKKKKKVANFDPDTFSVMRCEFCSAGFDTRAGLSSHARAHLRDFGITNWQVTVSPILVLRELFASRPDLVLPTAPPRTRPTPGEQRDSDAESEEERRGFSAGFKRGKADDVLRESPPPQSRKRRKVCYQEGEEEQQEKGGEDEDDEDEDEDEMPVLDGVAPGSPAEARLSALESGDGSPREEQDSRGMLTCKMCSAQFETKRGLSSHARSHLRQLGVGMSESSGAPIDLLYQIAKERSLPCTSSSSPPLSSRTPAQPDADKAPSSPSAAREDKDTSIQEYKDIRQKGYKDKQNKSGEGMEVEEEEDDHQQEDEEEEEEDVKPPVLSLALQLTPSSPHVTSPSPAVSSRTPSLTPSPFVRSRSPSPSPVLRKAPISSLLPVSSPLRSQEGRVGLGKVITVHPPPPPPPTMAPSKPYWAPEDNDTPLNLTMEPDPNKDIVCQLCGAWFETRKGLSSHARAHLRHFGVEYSESKGSPIDLLNRLVLTDDFKRRVANLSPSAGIEDLRSLVSFPLSTTPPPRHPASSSSSSASTSTSTSSKRPLHSSPSSLSSSSYHLFRGGHTGSGAGAASRSTTTTSSSSSSSSSSLYGPPSKKPRAAPQKVFIMPYSQAEPLKEVGCEFCGEYFENRKGLSSHARSHLRQMGITQWSVNGSPIDTLREVITRRGLPCAMPLKPLKSPPSSPAPLRVPVSSPSPLPPPPPPPPRPPSTSSSAPSGVFLGRLPFPFTHPPGQHQPTARRMELSASTSRTSAASPPAALLKPKPEPVQLEVTAPGSRVDGRDGLEGGGGGGGVGGGLSFNTAAECLSPSWLRSEPLHPISMAISHEPEPTRDIRCEFCGEYFENRKGLSSHARSHLRQMGITQWSVNGSPIDTLREIMRKQQQQHQQGGSSSFPAPLPSPSPSKGVKKEPRPASSSPPWDGLHHQPPRISRKPTLNLLALGARHHKPGLGLVGVSTGPVGSRFFTVVSPPSKRPLGEDGRSADRGSNQGGSGGGGGGGGNGPQHLPQDYSFKGKASPDKHGVGHMDASCELCGFYFENRKALASHARAHLRQFGVTEWSVNGSPIETLSAWMRSRPHKVAEMHRGYMQSGRSGSKKRGSSSSLSPSSDSGLPAGLSLSLKPSSALWSSLSQSRVRATAAEGTGGGHHWGSSRSSEVRGGGGGGRASSQQQGHHTTTPHLSSSALPHAQVARSELNVRLPRGFERRPVKHPSHPEAGERSPGPPRPPRTGTVPALVPKPPSTPLVKVVGKMYSLKCRFCEVVFNGPLSVQEDWIRHLQQHILNLNYSPKPATRTTTPDPNPKPDPDPDPNLKPEPEFNPDPDLSSDPNPNPNPNPKTPSETSSTPPPLPPPPPPGCSATSSPPSAAIATAITTATVVTHPNPSTTPAVASSPPPTPVQTPAPTPPPTPTILTPIGASTPPTTATGSAPLPTVSLPSPTT